MELTQQDYDLLKDLTESIKNKEQSNYEVLFLKWEQANLKDVELLTIGDFKIHVKNDYNLNARLSVVNQTLYEHMLSDQTEYIENAERSLDNLTSLLEEIVKSYQKLPF